MAITGKKLSELINKINNIQGTERIYVSDGTNVPKYIETGQLAKSTDIPDVSGFITENQADGKYQPKGDYATTEQLSNKADKIEVKSVEGATPTQEIQPNRFYNFGECSSLTVTLAEGMEGIYNEYMFQFTSGAVATTLNLPESIRWAETPVIESNKTYQISIVNNIAVIRNNIQSSDKKWKLLFDKTFEEEYFQKYTIGDLVCNEYIVMCKIVGTSSSDSDIYRQCYITLNEHRLTSAQAPTPSNGENWFFISRIEKISDIIYRRDTIYKWGFERETNAKLNTTDFVYTGVTEKDSIEVFVGIGCYFGVGSTIKIYGR